MLKIRRSRRSLFALTMAMLVSLAMLSACGFKLRGAAETSLPFKTLYLGFPENSALGVELKRNIRAIGNTEIVADAKQADAILDVVQPERQDRVVLSLNGAGQPVEYTLWYRFSFRVRDNQGRELLPVTAIPLHRDLNYNAALALAKEAEAQSLYRDMQSDLVQQILRRLAAIKPAP